MIILLILSLLVLSLNSVVAMDSDDLSSDILTDSSNALAIDSSADLSSDLSSDLSGDLSGDLSISNTKNLSAYGEDLSLNNANKLDASNHIQEFARDVSIGDNAQVDISQEDCNNLNGEKENLESLEILESSSENYFIGDDSEPSKFNQKRISAAAENQELLKATYTVSDFSSLQTRIKNAANGDIIQISGTITVTNCINITKNIVLVGINDAVIKSSASNGTFWVAASVAIKNIAFVNSTVSTKHYGIITFDEKKASQCNLTNCSFINNKGGSESDNVIVYVGGSQIQITDCSFINNSVSKEDGIIYVEGSNSIINSNVFINNTGSSSSFGVIYLKKVKSTIQYNVFDNAGKSIVLKESSGSSFNNNFWGSDYVSSNASGINSTKIKIEKSSSYTLNNWINLTVSGPDSSGAYTLKLVDKNGNLISSMPDYTVSLSTSSSGYTYPSTVTLSNGVGTFLVEGDGNPTLSFKNSLGNVIMSNQITAVSAKKDTVTTVELSASSINYGSSVTITPTVKAGNTVVTTGGDDRVQILVNNSVVATISCTGTYTYTPTATGTFSIVAYYLGQGNKYGASTSSPKTLTVNKLSTSTSVSLSSNSIDLGDSITVSSTVSNGASGTVYYYYSLNGESYSSIGSASVGSSVSFTPDSAGTYTIYAWYYGNSYYEGSTSSTKDLTVSLPIQETTTSIILSEESIEKGSSVVIAPKVMSNGAEVKTGTVEIFYYSNSIANITAGNTYTYTPSSNLNYPLKAVYNGNSVYASSQSSTVTLHVWDTPEWDFKINSSAELTVDFGTGCQLELTRIKGPYTETANAHDVVFYFNNLQSSQSMGPGGGSINHVFNEAGDFEVYAYYVGSDNWISVSSNVVLVHVKYPERATETSISLSSGDVDVGDTITISPEVKYGSSAVTWGTVEIYLNGEAIKNITAGSTWDISADMVGTNSISAKYLGTLYNGYNYTSSSASANFNVKCNAAFTVRVNPGKDNQTNPGSSELSIDFHDRVTFLMYFDDVLSASNNVYDVYVNGVYDSTRNFSTWYPEIDSYGEMSYYFVFKGNGTHNSATSNSVTIYVPMNTVTHLDVSSASINLGDSVTITPKVWASGLMLETGDVELFSNGESIANITAGSSYVYAPVDSGNYLISASYKGTKIYNPSSSTDNPALNVRESGSFSLGVNSGDNNGTGEGMNSAIVYVGNHITLVPSIQLSKSSDPSFVVYRNGSKIYNGTLANGLYSQLMGAVGNYSFYMVFEGDEYYNQMTSNSVTVEVLPIQTDLVISADDEDYPNRIIISHVLTSLGDGSDISGTIEYFLNGIGIGSADIGSDFTLPLLDADSYAVTAKFISSNPNYASSDSNEIEVEVFRSVPTIAIAEDSGYLIPSLSEGATGTITYIVDAIPRDPVSVGTDLDISNLMPGRHVIIVSYSGDRNYEDNFEYYVLDIDKYDVSISLEDYAITYPNSGRIIFNASVSGNYTVIINDKRYSVEVIKAEGAEFGQGTIDVGLLDSDDYAYEVIYYETQYYKGASKIAYYNVSQYGPVLNIQFSDGVDGDCSIFYGESVSAMAKLYDLNENIFSDAKGTVTYIITDSNGNSVGSDTISLLDIFTNSTNLNAGSYFISAHYNGDVNYAEADSNILEFEVRPLIQDISVEIEDVSVTYPNRGIVSINSNADGLYTIVINKKEYSIEVSGGKGSTIPIDVLDVGVYDISISADIENYALFNNDSIAKYSVSQAKPALDIRDSLVSLIGGDLTLPYGLTITINPKLTLGDSILTIDDTIAEVVYYIDGFNKASLDLSECFVNDILGVGTHTIQAIYLGDKNYESVQTGPIELTVSKINPVIDVEGDDIVYGEDALLKFNFTGLNGAGLNGIINVSVGDRIYNIAVVNGKANLSVSNLNASDVAYNVHAVSIESENYNSASNDLAKIMVSKSSDAKFDVNVIGDEIVIRLSDDKGNLISANINISINGEDYHEIAIVDGLAGISTDGLGNEMDISLRFNGDNNYEATEIDKNFILEENVKSDLDVIIQAQTISYGSEEIITIKLTDDGGNAVSNFDLDLILDGKSVTAATDSNGMIVYKVPYALNAGTYEAVINYDGGLVYNPISKSEKFIVEKLATIIESSAFTTYATSGDYMSFCLKDSNGKALANKNMTITLDNQVYNLITDGSGIARIQVNLENKGSYSLTASFAGDENYNSSLEIYNVLVKPKSLDIIVSDLTFSSSSSTKYMTARLMSNGAAVANKKISFYVNGKTYSVISDANGLVKVNVNLSAKKSYPVIVKFEGDNTYGYSYNKFNLKIV